LKINLVSNPWWFNIQMKKNWDGQLSNLSFMEKSPKDIKYLEAFIEKIRKK